MLNRHKNFKFTIISFALLVCAFFAYLLHSNTNIQTSYHVYENNGLPTEFDGYIICHVSDLHSATFGESQSILVQKVEATQPDAIFVTGDLIDKRKYDLNAAMQFINSAVEIAPVYYVSGNHEAWSGEYKSIKFDLENAGVVILDDDKTELSQDGAIIDLYGLKDPDFLTHSYMQGTDDSALNAKLLQWQSERENDKNENFSILLSHRPELFNMYVESGMNLVFSGHAHGGQIRLPFIGGLFAPDQGFFPKYTNGFYTQGETSMFVSRGLGNSIFPLRIFNRPHLAAITLSGVSK